MKTETDQIENLTDALQQANQLIGALESAMYTWETKSLTEQLIRLNRDVIYPLVKEAYRPEAVYIETPSHELP